MSRSQVDAAFPWFALQVKSRHEKAVSLSLRSKGYVEFLPLYHSRCSSGRSRDVELPLFPTYVFCRFNPCRRLPILMTPGVFSIVGTKKGPLPIDDAELSAIQATVDSGLHAEPFPFIQIGDYVCIEAGPLRGRCGIVQRVKDQDRLIVSITLLQRSISIEMEPSWLRINAALSEGESEPVIPRGPTLTAASRRLPSHYALRPEQIRNAHAGATTGIVSVTEARRKAVGPLYNQHRTLD